MPLQPGRVLHQPQGVQGGRGAFPDRPQLPGQRAGPGRGQADVRVHLEQPEAGGQPEREARPGAAPGLQGPRGAVITVRIDPSH